MLKNSYKLEKSSQTVNDNINNFLYTILNKDKGEIYNE